MSDITEKQMDDVVSALNKAAGSLSKLVNGATFAGAMAGVGTSQSISRRSSSRVLSDDLKARKDDTGAIKEHFMRVRESVGTIGALNSTVKKIAEGFAGFEILEKVWEYGKREISTYQELTGAGQTFGGSMIKMSQQAAAAGLPLKMFAEVIEKNSVVVGQMGVQSFFKLNKQVLALTVASGNYGMTMQQMTDLTGQYMDIQRLAGRNIKDLSGPTTAKSIADFALNLTSMSDVMGTSRKQTLDNLQAATEDAGFQAQERINSAKGATALTNAYITAAQDLAAQAGPAGKELSSMLTQTVGNPAGAIMSDLGKAFTKVGAGDLVSAMDNAKRAIDGGADAHVTMENLVSQFKDRLNDPQLLQALQNMRANGGELAGAADQIIHMAGNITTYTEADRKKAEEQTRRMGAFTNFFASFEQLFENIKGKFMDGFLTPFLALDKSGSLKNFADTMTEKLGPAAMNLGSALGNLITAVFTPKNMENMGHFFTDMVAFGAILVNVTSSIIKVVVPIVGVIGKAFEVLHKVIGFILTPLGSFGKALTDIITAVAAFVAFMKVEKFVSKLFGGGAKLVTVRGGIVNVLGGNGNGGGNNFDDLSGDGEGKGSGKKGSPKERAARARRLRAARARGMRGGRGAAQAAEMAADAAEDSGKILGSRGGKIAGFVGKSFGGRFGGLASKFGGVAGKLSGPLGLLGSFSKVGGMSTVKNIGGVVLKHAAIAGTIFTAIGAISQLHDYSEQVKAGTLSPHEAHKASIKMLGGIAGGVGGGILAGAAMGAMAGSIVPGAGTLVGGLIGAGVGLIGSSIGSSAGSWASGAIFDAATGTKKTITDKAAAATGTKKTITDKAAAATGTKKTITDKAAAATAPGTTAKPAVVDDDYVMRTRTNALLGNDEAISQLKKIQEGLEKQTMILASQQKQIANNQRGTTTAINNNQGGYGN